MIVSFNFVIQQVPKMTNTAQKPEIRAENVKADFNLW